MEMTGGQALARQLALEGIDVIFGIPGVQLDWAVDAIRQMDNRLCFVVPRHEQTAAYMADGYARSTGRIGTCMVVPGPGLLNAMSGLATAYACSSPVLCIAGQVHSTAIGKSLGQLHEVANQTGILRAVTKWNAIVQTPEQIPGLVREAVKQLRTGRPQPVGLEVPYDLLARTSEVNLIDPPKDEDYRLRPDAKDIERAARTLQQAKLPVIYAGGGVLAANASEALRRLAEKLNAPVVISDNGKGSLSDRHPLTLSSLGGRVVFPYADVVLVVGSRFIDSLSPSPAWPEDGKTYIYLNIEPNDWSEPRTAHIAVHSDAALGLDALAGAVGPRKATRSFDLEKVRDWGESVLPEVKLQADYVRALREGMPDDGILVNELTQVGYVARMVMPVYSPRTFITPGYQGTLGYGFPTALGAAYGNPGRAVVSITGDGGFGYNMQELSTARKYGLAVTVVVFNDGHFGNVRTIQKTQFGGEIGVDLLNPDFRQLAGAFGVAYALVDSPIALEAEMKRATASGGPALIEVRIGEVPGPWHLLRLRPGATTTRTAPPTPDPF
ncbi:MAG: thiamine pyrophosphate-binding protein [Actinobacteria bacterium]|nr:thiamine pyrophosphate-binding protein [Actinomycetota bacterium]